MIPCGFLRRLAVVSLVSLAVGDLFAQPAAPPGAPPALGVADDPRSRSSSDVACGPARGPHRVAPVDVAV